MKQKTIPQLEREFEQKMPHLYEANLLSDATHRGKKIGPHVRVYWPYKDRFGHKLNEKIVVPKILEIKKHVVKYFGPTSRIIFKGRERLTLADHDYMVVQEIVYVLKEGA